jgi:lipoprotein YgeR
MEKNGSLQLLFCSVCCLIFFLSCHSRGGAFYRIEKGDTVWRVAHAHDVDIDEIKRANPQLNVDNLEIGDRIFLPQVSQIRKVPKHKLNTEQWIPRQQTQKKSANQQSKISRQKASGSVPHPFKWPYRGPVISTFGMRNQKMHNGIDIQIPSNETIRASFKGKVVYVGDQIEGYDRIVILLHDNHFFSIYAYLGEILVRQDQTMQTGDPIAKPRPTSPSYFHFEIRYIKTSLDPEKYLNK